MRPFPTPRAESTEAGGSTFADYVVTALSPALIMGLVGSLVFFLAEIFYAGNYEGRLLYTLFFYVAGIVLVSRIGIVVDPGRAVMYGLVLTAVCYIALLAYVAYPDSLAGKLAGGINLLLMGLVWWSANKLTRDCTHIDERRESTDRGLLSAVGFEGRTLNDPDDGAEIVLDRKTQKLGWWERYREYRRLQELKPHTPGTTIIYFSMAALPIFGLGQSLVPASDTARRHFTFVLAAGYVGCAMGLLLTTSFLGVRRYLRQRNLKMPPAMTGLWLGVGAAFIVGFLVVGAFLPRPQSETPLVKLDFLKANSGERNASKNAQVRDGDAGKGEGKGGSKTEAGDGTATAKGGKAGGKGDGESKEGSGTKAGQNGGGQSKDGGKQNGGSKGEPKGGESKGSDKGSDRKGDSPKGERKEGNQAKSQEGDTPQKSGDTMKDFQASQLGSVVQTLANILKWIVFAIVLLIVLFVLAFVLLRNIAPFTKWAEALLAKMRAFLARLFGPRDGPATAAEEPEAAEERRVPFAEFSNPFEDGSAPTKRADALIHYSFAALEAWAGDRAAGRKPTETPHEFAGRLQEAFPEIDPQAAKLANLLARLEYAGGPLPANVKESLQKVWEQMAEPARVSPAPS